MFFKKNQEQMVKISQNNKILYILAVYFFTKFIKNKKNMNFYIHDFYSVDLILKFLFKIAKTFEQIKATKAPLAAPVNNNTGK